MYVKDITGAIEEFAPLGIQENWDNSGLCIGSPSAEVTSVTIGLDCTPELVDEAIRTGSDMIVTHHPLIFSGLKKISPDDPVGLAVIKAIRAGINVYAAHTNLDNAPGGVNFKMAEKLGLKNIRILEPKGGEWGMEAGSGVIGELGEPETESDFLHRVKKLFEVECLQHNRLNGREIQQVALCGGAGAFLIPEAIRQRADVFLTGEIKYHEFFGHENEILLAAIGHYESEQYTKELFYTLIREMYPDLEMKQTRVNTNPIKYM